MSGGAAIPPYNPFNELITSGPSPDILRILSSEGWGLPCTLRSHPTTGRSARENLVENSWYLWRIRFLYLTAAPQPRDGQELWNY